MRCSCSNTCSDETTSTISPVQMKALQAIYLIENLARLFAEGYDAADNDMVGWYCQLLQKLSPARKEMVAA